MGIRVVSALRSRIKKTLPGLDHFFMIGHWVEPGGGLPPAAMSGRNVVKILCKELGRKFHTEAEEAVRL